MSKKKTNKVWNGMNVVEETDTTTGIIRIYSRATGSGRSKVPEKLLATSAADGSYTLNDEPEFRKRYNNAQRTQGKATLSKEEFDKEFNKTGTEQFNRDRAEVLNDKSNYASEEEWERATNSFTRSGTPFVKDEKNGKVTNSDGKLVDDPEKNPNKGEDNEDFDIVNDPLPIPDRGTGGDQSVLRYPLDRIPDLGYDYVTFSAYEYQAGALTTATGEERIGAAMERITLPILPNIEESNGVEWGEDKLNEVQKLAAGVAMNTMNSKNPGEAIANFADSTTDAVNELLNKNTDLRNQIIAHFAGQAVGANILGRKSGAVLNPNLELLFKGPQLRTFNFSFKLRPRYKEENQMCKLIIRAFKRNMHVQRSTSDLFLTTPNIFKINYYFNDGADHPYMNRLKPCALTNFKVNYTPDNSYMTYGDGGLTGYDINLSFSEIAPIYADEINGQSGMSY